MAARLNYDKIAPTFDARYQTDTYDDLLIALRTVIAQRHPSNALEAGCGTGHWLAAVSDLVPNIYGFDYSFGMLQRARAQGSSRIVQGSALEIPFRNSALDVVFCVNALHHFGNVEKFIAEARRVLKPGGTLAIIGMDPHHERDSWCVYEYFPETRATDIRRYPSSGQVADAMLRAGFDHVETRMAGHFGGSRVGQAIFDDPELTRNGCSQMSLLTDEQYAAGIERINAALRGAPSDSPPVFTVDIAVMLHCGTVSDPGRK